MHNKSLAFVFDVGRRSNLFLAAVGLLRCNRKRSSASSIIRVTFRCLLLVFTSVRFLCYVYSICSKLDIYYCYMNTIILFLQPCYYTRSDIIFRWYRIGLVIVQPALFTNKSFSIFPFFGWLPSWAMCSQKHLSDCSWL